MDQSWESNKDFQQAWNGAFGGQANLDKSTAIQLQSTILDLFMDLVECMGAEVAQQPQMREASQGLLTQSLQADKQANAELTESGLRLLTTLFVNDPGGAENYKVMIAQPVLFDLPEASVFKTSKEKAWIAALAKPDSVEWSCQTPGLRIQSSIVVCKCLLGLILVQYTSTEDFRLLMCRIAARGSEGHPNNSCAFVHNNRCNKHWIYF